MKELVVQVPEKLVIPIEGIWQTYEVLWLTYIFWGLVLVMTIAPSDFHDDFKRLEAEANGNSFRGFVQTMIVYCMVVMLWLYYAHQELRTN